jgi:Zn-dependent M28 family amino/carboxypeptidase
LGSRYFVSHPTVELSSIAAVLNGDMMGRNAPDSAALLGATEPHLNSSDLVAITLLLIKLPTSSRYFLGCCRSSRDGTAEAITFLCSMYQQYFLPLYYT